MNGFIVLDPVGIPQKSSRKAMERVETLDGKRIGFIWGTHELSTKFWPVLEEEQKGDHDKEKIPLSYTESLDLADKDINDNWDIYQERFLRGDFP